MADGPTVTLLSRPLAEQRRRSADLLRGIADEIERGDVLGFVGVVDLPGGRYEHVATRHASRHELMGILLDAAIEKGVAGD